MHHETHRHNALALSLLKSKDVHSVVDTDSTYFNAVAFCKPARAGAKSLRLTKHTKKHNLLNNKTHKKHRSIPNTTSVCRTDEHGDQYRRLRSMRSIRGAIDSHTAYGRGLHSIPDRHLLQALAAWRCSWWRYRSPVACFQSSELQKVAAALVGRCSIGHQLSHGQDQHDAADGRRHLD
ncbi:unnamed protein product [Urochloa humidicola]